MAHFNPPSYPVTPSGQLDLNRLLNWLSAITEWARTVDSELRHPDIQVFEATGGVTTQHTWHKPADARLIEIILIGGGGGGGTGRSDIAGTARPGGGGGGGGAYTHFTFPTELFRSSERVLAGAGGAGGVAPGAGVGNGVAGSAGGTSSITCASPINFIVAGGGNGGGAASAAGATMAGGGRGGIQGGLGSPSASDGGVGQVQGLASFNDLAGTLIDQNVGQYALERGCIGGASGGGITVANVLSAGGASTIPGWTGQALAVAGTSGVSNGQGGAGVNSPIGQWLPGGGGGGASAFGAGSGGLGGAGGRYGGGGGGGSGRVNTSAVGNGGRGGDGIAVIISHF